MKLKPLTIVKSLKVENDPCLKDGETFLYIGEISNYPNHCVVADNEGRIQWDGILKTSKKQKL